MLLYDARPAVVLLGVFILLWAVALGCYRIGLRFRPETTKDGPLYLPDSVPAGIQATLALILGFTFSMVIGRFEQRRQLVIDEANQINSTYQQSQALRSGHEELESLFRRYLDTRIEYYEKRAGSAEAREVDEKTSQIEHALWDKAYRLTRTDRGAIENGFLGKLNEMSDLRLARNFALIKTMPREIYIVILLLCIATVAASNFARGARSERGTWQPAIAVAVISLVFTLIVDIDQPTLGGISISQDAMHSVREDLTSLASKRVSPGGAAGKAPSLHRPSARGKHQ